MSTTLKDGLATEYLARLRWQRQNATVRHGLMPDIDYDRQVEVKTPEAPPAPPKADKDAAPFPDPEPEPPGKPGPAPDAGKDDDQPSRAEGCNWRRLIIASALGALGPAAGLGLAMWLSQPSITVKPQTPPNLLQSLEDKGYNVP